MGGTGNHPAQAIHLLDHDAGHLLILAAVREFTLVVGGDALDGAQRVADFVGHPGGQAPDGGQFFRTPDFVLQAADLAQIPVNQDLAHKATLFVDDSRGADADRKNPIGSEFTFHFPFGNRLAPVQSVFQATEVTRQDLIRVPALGLPQVESRDALGGIVEKGDLAVLVRGDQPHRQARHDLVLDGAGVLERPLGGAVALHPEHGDETGHA